ncbi:lipopolysaccharide transport periplasmic protein LptA [Neiella marina]|uniref:Lipopolysaccharide export system protein LptA n=1 Tax=Neiella holothuriorum TaxID=2870530 RepID=A0ABS7EAV6_9GAMM|nr:lipopolysaccharide transport periplasmic protein LptA [Neiella holothuriorum]MBW8189469.1 lipopolysaccharide transport periplasmic protein LptA [Neiella holothuriorum]
MNTRLRISALALALWCQSSIAIQEDFNEKVEISAQRNAFDIKANVLNYIGDVKVTQGTMQIFADKLTILNANVEGQQVLVAEGSPVRYSQILDNGKVMDAQANNMRYELNSRILLLTGDAQVTQEDSLVKGERIRYNLAKQLLEADGNADGSNRVTTIFIPEQVKQQIDEDDSSEATPTSNEGN